MSNDAAKLYPHLSIHTHKDTITTKWIRIIWIMFKTKFGVSALSFTPGLKSLCLGPIYSKLKFAKFCVFRNSVMSMCRAIRHLFSIVKMGHRSGHDLWVSRYGRSCCGTLILLWQYRYYPGLPASISHSVQQMHQHSEPHLKYGFPTLWDAITSVAGTVSLPQSNCSW